MLGYGRERCWSRRAFGRTASGALVDTSRDCRRSLRSPSDDGAAAARTPNWRGAARHMPTSGSSERARCIVPCVLREVPKPSLVQSLAPLITLLRRQMRAGGSPLVKR